jgi:hypothetical protein
MVPVVVYVNGYRVPGFEYSHELWVERGEDWYAMSSPQLRDKRVRVVKREQWLRAKAVDEEPRSESGVRSFDDTPSTEGELT